MKWRLLAVACVLLALGLLLYPLMGELVSEKYHSDVELSLIHISEPTRP